MKVAFLIPAPLRVFTRGLDRVDINLEVQPATLDREQYSLRDALEKLWMLYPGLRDRVANEQGHLRDHVNLFVGNEDVKYTGGLLTRVPDGAEISIVAAVSGGAKLA